MQLIRLLAGFLGIGPGAPVAPAADGVPNFQQVNGRIYRGGQPSDYGFKFIARLGVKTVIDLRRESSEEADEEKLVSAAGLRFINIPMDDLRAPTDAQIALALAVLADEFGRSGLRSLPPRRRPHRHRNRLLPHRLRALAEPPGSRRSQEPRHEHF